MEILRLGPLSKTDCQVLDLVSYIPLCGCVVEAAGVKLVVVVLDDLGGVEDGQDGTQGASVPVVRHSTSVVTFSCHVVDGVKGHFLCEGEPSGSSALRTD